MKTTHVSLRVEKVGRVGRYIIALQACERTSAYACGCLCIFRVNDMSTGHGTLLSPLYACMNASALISASRRLCLSTVRTRNTSFNLQTQAQAAPQDQTFVSHPGPTSADSGPSHFLMGTKKLFKGTNKLGLRPNKCVPVDKGGNCTFGPR